MGVFKLGRKIRGAPRLKITEEAEYFNQIRFTTKGHKKILSANIFDISESGISFVCNKKSAPQIDEIIMMEFIPINSIQIACMGHVVRIETPSKQATWNHFPESVKVGITYHHLPEEYKKLISDSLQKAFNLYKATPQATYHSHKKSESLKWFLENWQSLLATMALLIGTYVGAKLIWENTRDIKPDAPQWSKGVFEQTLNRSEKR
ncbi:MAG: PilZ domain-containing protein [Oligoflexia bacterium]|nr:PilZ domain-containing protein [Oligoflexia bacterium]